MAYKGQTKRQQLEIIRTQLDSERSTFLTHWRDIGDFICPRRPRFTVYETNKGYKKNQNIIDSTATLALRTLRSGMMSGVTSPARPWFRLANEDPDLNELPNVKQWLDTVSSRMTTVFIKSNLYNVLPIVYGDMGAFGTSAMYMEEDDQSVVRFYPFPIGSYMISNNEKLQVDTFYREFRLTVRQLVKKFGVANPEKPDVIDWSKFSQAIQDQYDNGQYEEWVNVSHMILPNENYKPGNPMAKFKKYSSYYYETGNGPRGGNLYDDRMLSESGYDFFPVLCPRWEINGEDVYGTSCPGMDALGDVRQLQKGESRGLQAIEKMVNPPMSGPTSLKNQSLSILPGDVTYLDVREGQQGFRPIHEVRFSVQELEGKQQQVRERIRRAFYEDLFLMLAASDRRQITAREIDERHEEKLLALGPVLEQLNQDLLDPLIDNTFDMMAKHGLIPEPPPELQGKDLKVEYISVMAQAQKVYGISGLERFSGFIGQVAQLVPDVLNKINVDQLVDVYGDITSVPAGIIRGDDEVAAMREQQQQAQQAQQQAMLAEQQSKTAKNLSQSDTSGDNALSAMLAQAKAGSIANG